MEHYNDIYREDAGLFLIVQQLLFLTIFVLFAPQNKQKMLHDSTSLKVNFEQNRPEFMLMS